MKESMNLEQFKHSNILVGLYVDENFIESQLANIGYTLSEQEKNVDLLVIANRVSEEKLENIKSILSSPYAIIRSQGEEGQVIETKLESEKKLNFVVSHSDIKNLSAFYNLIFNTAQKGGYEFMTICESEDSFARNWFAISERYAIENSGVDIFLPVIRNTINGVFTGFLNEATWVEGMSEEAGKADISLLSRFNCINALGALYKVSSIAEYSEKKEDGLYYPMKESFKISHYYEFFLRMIYNDLKVLTVPRVGYEAQITRKSYYNDITCKLPQNITELPESQGGITPQEGSFWMELAKKEYFFDEDRNKQYQPQS